MELLELFTKAIAPQLLTRIFDNIPQYIILFGFISIFAIKFLLKWNKARVEKFELKEARSETILKNTNNLISEVHKIKEDQIQITKKLEDYKDKINEKVQNLDNRIIKIETKEEYNKEKNNLIIDTLNSIKERIKWLKN